MQSCAIFVYLRSSVGGREVAVTTNSIPLVSTSPTVATENAKGM